MIKEVALDNKNIFCFFSSEPISFLNVAKKLQQGRLAPQNKEDEIKVLTVLTSKSSMLSTSEIHMLHTLTEFMYMNKSMYKEAIVVNTPRATALFMLYASMANNSSSFNIKIFSSKKTAVHWLNNSQYPPHVI
jgi:hypothetical protein